MNHSSTVPEATQRILARLADDEWKRIRSFWNRQFMTYGPSPEWEQIKSGLPYRSDQETIRLLREYLELKPE